MSDVLACYVQQRSIYFDRHFNAALKDVSFRQYLEDQGRLDLILDFLTLLDCAWLYATCPLELELSDPSIHKHLYNHQHVFLLLVTPF